MEGHHSQILEKLADAGIMVTSGAFREIIGNSDPGNLTEDLITHSKNAHDCLVKLTEADVSTLLKKRKNTVKTEPKNVNTKKNFSIINDFSEYMGSDGTADEFTKYMRSRYEQISVMLKANKALEAPKKISKLEPSDEPVSIIGMVMNAVNLNKGHMKVVIDDPTGSVDVFINSRSPLARDIYLKDEVIGVVGKFDRRQFRGRTTNTLYADEIHRPSLSSKPLNRSESDTWALFISDIHIGSNTFLKGDWEKFVGWLSGKKDVEQAREIRRKLGYIVIAGDLVDGVGIYPGHEKDLDIKDLDEQYSILGKYLSDIPKDVKIIMIPGNHDAVRGAEPQPEIPERFRKHFPANCVFTTNPVYLDIEGIRTLVYHGRSMDEFIMQFNHISYQKPIESMEEMLKRRHLTPTYGAKVPIAPENDDHLVIRELPDIFVTGHVHTFEAKALGGTLLLNASCWQGQTDYQAEHGVEPNPCIATAVHLKTRKTVVMDVKDWA